jgi:hypothetical protein
LLIHFSDHPGFKNIVHVECANYLLVIIDYGQ